MSSAKLEEGEGESSRCCDQVFGSRVTTSTLAGEYVTARGYVGGRACCGKLRDEDILYKERFEELRGGSYSGRCTCGRRRGGWLWSLGSL